MFDFGAKRVAWISKECVKQFGDTRGKKNLEVEKTGGVMVKSRKVRYERATAQAYREERVYVW
jgi:hypothetical protein